MHCSGRIDLRQRSAEVVTDTTQAVRWYLRDGKLCLELPADAGVLWLGAAGRDTAASSGASNNLSTSGGKGQHRFHREGTDGLGATDPGGGADQME
jgi:hypothetical protein